MTNNEREHLRDAFSSVIAWADHSNALDDIIHRVLPEPSLRRLILEAMDEGRIKGYLEGLNVREPT
jgi:hypothetical protein